MHVTIDRRQQRVLQIAPVGIEQSSRTNEAVLSAQYVVDAGIGEEAIADLGQVRRGRVVSVKLPPAKVPKMPTFWGFIVFNISR